MAVSAPTTSPLLLALLLACLALSACGGGSNKRATEGHATSAAVSDRVPIGRVVAVVGGTPITGTIYTHWMTIGAATVEMPKPGHPLPKPIEYRPPDFAACVASLHARAPGSTTAQLRSTCGSTYDRIQARVLGFLITGYWLREDATREGISISPAEVRSRFEEERRRRYPTAASFRRLQEASRQTIADLEFSVQTQMLSEKLLERFTSAHAKGQPEQTAIAAFNRNLREVWTAKTDCKPGYVVRGCRQFK